MSYTPTTEEVRQSFVYAESSEFVATVPGNGNDAWARVPASGDVKATRVRDGKIQSEATAEFDRWLAALIREAKAEALEEASLAYGSGQLSGIFLGRDDYPKAWLRARAAEYRKAVRDGAQESE